MQHVSVRHAIVAFVSLAAGVCQAQLSMGRPIPPRTATVTKPAAPPARFTKEPARSEDAQVAELMNRLTPKERKRLAKAIKRMTPEERRQFAQALRRQLAARKTATGPGR